MILISCKAKNEKDKIPAVAAVSSYNFADNFKRLFMQNRINNLMLFAVACLLLFAFIEIRAQSKPTVREKVTDAQAEIAEVKFVGLQNFEESDIRSELRNNSIFVAEGRKYDLNEIGKAVELIQKVFFQLGYFNAKTVVYDERPKDNQKTIVFSIKEGTRTNVTEIGFEGNKLFTDQELLEPLKQCLDDSWTLYDERLFHYCLNKYTREFLRSRGYLKAGFGKPKKHFDSIGLSLTVPIDEGVRYRIGKITIEGATVFTPQQILEMMELKKGEIANGEELRDFVYEKLKTVYGNKGYIQFSPGIDDFEFINPSEAEQDGTVNLKIWIDEGKSFELARLSFVGVDSDTESLLKQTLGLKENQIFNRGAFEDGVKRINEMEKFQWIDADKDSEFGVSEEQGNIVLKIKVRKIE